MIAPKLRFSEFRDEWQSKKIIKIADYVDYRGKTPTKTDTGILLVTAKNIKFGYLDYETSQEFINEDDFDEVMRRGKVKIDDVLITTEAPLGNVALVDREDIALAQRVIKYRGKENILNNRFLLQKFLGEKFQEILTSKATGGTVQGIKGSVLHQIEISLPSLKEQTKVAEFLSAVDDKISQLSRQLELLNQYKKGVMQKIFSQEIRFKNDNGEDFEDWETTTLDNFLTVSKLKNKELIYSKNEVLSVSGELGIVNQIALLGRSYAGVSVAPYGIVEYGDIVYTKSPLKSNPYGIIKANKGKAGIVSTLYAVYKCNDNILPNLLDYYFQSDIKLNNYLRPLVRKGAKNDMKVNNQDVLNGVVCFPNSMKEQKIIIEFLTAIDERIDHTTAQLTHTKQWKKGLLQQMFV